MIRIAYQAGTGPEPHAGLVEQAKSAARLGADGLVIDGGEMPTMQVLEVDDLAAHLRGNIPRIPIVRGALPDDRAEAARHGIAMIRIAQQVGGDGTICAFARPGGGPLDDEVASDVLPALEQMSEHFSVTVATESEDGVVTRLDDTVVATRLKDTEIDEQTLTQVVEQLVPDGWLVVEHTSGDADHYRAALTTLRTATGG